MHDFIQIARFKGLFLLLLTLTSFGVGLLGVDPDEYVKAYNSNKPQLSTLVNDGEVNYSWMYVPNELRLIQLQKRGALQGEKAEEFIKERQEYVECLLQIGTPKTSRNFLDYAYNDAYGYEDRLAYYSFDMKQDIVAVVDMKDTIPCSDYMFERNFGASPKGSFIVGFVGIKKFETIEIILKNKAIGGTPISFELAKEHITALPTLKNYKKWKK